jgi:tetratricopeptide (TPR) repeat protein
LIEDLTLQSKHLYQRLIYLYFYPPYFIKMNQFLVIAKNSLKNKSTYLGLLVNVIIGILNYIAKRNFFFGDTLYIRIYIALIPIILFFPINNFLNIVKYRKEQGFVSSKTFTTKQIKLASIGKIINLIAILIAMPLFILVPGINEVLSHMKSDAQICAENFKKRGILIANFSEVIGDVDGFTTSLYGRLNSDLQHVDTLNVQPLGKFITETNRSYIDTIKKTFKENCNTSGLIVFGSRKDNTYFNCRIYSYNFLNYRAKGFSRTKDSTVIYIQNPKTLEFTIDYETNVVSTFIHGLLYRNAGKYELSTKLINEAIKLNQNPANTQFIAICHLFVGNNLLNQGLLKEAQNEYEIGEKIDSLNGNIHFNIGSTYSESRDVSKAFGEYELAEKIDPSLRNPLKKINTGPQIVNSKPLKIHLTKKLSLKIDTGNKITKMDIAPDWEEHCYKVSSNKKYGVVNNNGDTIVKCLYDNIESYPYKNVDCFIVELRGKYGAFIHKHTNVGWDIWPIQIEFSENMIKYIVQNCVDQH